MPLNTGKSVKIRPARKLQGTIILPGDKSISHRALLFAALAEGRSELQRLAPGQDVASTVRCLRGLGIEIDKKGSTVVVHGKGLGGLQPPGQTLDAGNSGTTLRLLAGILAGQPFHSTIDGDGSLRQRPMQRIIEPLSRMGAEILAAKGGRAPLEIHGRPLTSISYTLPVASAQVKSCLLLAGLFAQGTTEVIEPRPTRDHTEIILQNMGVKLWRDGHKIRRHSSPLRPVNLCIPGDFSSAAFFIAAGLLIPESRIVLKNVGMNPTRNHFLQVIRKMGAEIIETGPKEQHGEKVAELVVEPQALRAIEVYGGTIPLVIDEIPILAILATQARGTTMIRDAHELRLKESDRIEALTTNLRRMGAHIRTFEDGLQIEGPVQLKGAQVDAHGDHRIAMAFSIAGLIARGETVIHGAHSVAVSYPTFYQELFKLMND